MKRRGREGMALLMVLLLVAAVSAIAVLVLDDVRFTLRRTMNLEHGAQARWLAIGGQSLAMAVIARSHRATPGRTPVEPVWLDRPRTYPVDGGVITVTVSDGQTCFNLNSVAEGYGEYLIGRESGRLQLVALARGLGVPHARAEALGDALSDWIDSDSHSRPRGAEDSAYTAGTRPYRTGGTLLAEVSELRAVRGVDPALYRTLRPHVCALPEAGLSMINVNTLKADQAPLLVMLAGGGLDEITARAVIASRPPSGWRDAADFRGHPALSALATAPGLEQATVRTRFFDIRVDVELGGERAVRSALVEVEDAGTVRPVIHRLTTEE